MKNSIDEMRDEMREEIENCEACAIVRQYADIGETMLCKKHYEIEGMITVTTKDTRSDEEISDALWTDSNPENCDGCANQESIASPGETTKCREHQEYATMEDVVCEEIEESESEEIASDDEVDQWFIERASEFEFHPFVTRCSMCFKREAFYVGVTTHGTPFEFCQICRDDLVRRADAAKQSPERFGV